MGGIAVALTPECRSTVPQSNKVLAGTPLRTLGVVSRALPPGAGPFNEGVERDLVFLGLVGMVDRGRATRRRRPWRPPAAAAYTR